jgi:hypothetical protein
MVMRGVLFDVQTEFLNVTPYVNSSKLPPCSRATNYLTLQIISTFSNYSWNQILPSLPQAFTTHHPNVFTLILSLSEGRAGIIWVPSNKMLFFPPDIKRPSFSLKRFLLSFLTLSLSLSIGFKALKQLTVL